MRGIFKNQFGVSLVEGMVGVGLLAAIGVGAMKLAETQKNADLGLKQSSELARTMTTVKQVISDRTSCELNFKNKTLNTTLDEIRNAKGEVVLKKGVPITGGYELDDIRLGEYSESSNRTKVFFVFNKSSKTGAPKVSRYTNIFVSVKDNKIEECLDPNELSSESLKKRFCRDLDPKATEDCEDNFDNLLEQMKALYCGNNHPFLQYDYATKKCLPLDANKKCAQGFVKGYDGNHNLVCYVPPTGPVDPPKECESWSAWAPSTDTMCIGKPLAQTRNCTSGLTETQSRTIQGTRNDNSCCTGWGPWSPGQETACSGVPLTQTRTCQAGWTGNETRLVTGTKPVGPWTPDLSTICKTQTVTQTNGCETRTIAGTKDCGECTVRHPIGWSVNQGSTQCHCAEYYMAPGGSGGQSTIPNGQERTFSGNFCQVSRSGSGSMSGHGTITVRCVNGSAQFVNPTCEGGMVR